MGLIPLAAANKNIPMRTKSTYGKILATTCIVAMVSIVSCNKEHHAFVPIPDTSAPIEFISTDNPTKGLDEINYDRIKNDDCKFGLFAFWNEEGKRFSNENGKSSLYLENRNMEYIDSEGMANRWRCSPAAYWPFHTWLNFFAYAPYQNAETQHPFVTFPSEDYVGGMPRIRFTPPQNVTFQPDFCVSAPCLDVSAADGSVLMTFHHTLTRVRFYINLKGHKAPEYKYCITDLTIKGVANSNILTYKEDKDKPYEWDKIDPSAPKTGTYHLSSAESQLTSVPVVFTHEPGSEVTGLDRYTYANELVNGRLYLLPQKLTSEAKIEVVISVFKIGNSELISMLPPFELSLPASTEWEDQKTVSYLMTINIENSKESAIVPAVSDWTDSDNTHDEEILE